MTRSEWENQLDKFPEANFLQSWEWGEFHQKLGHSVYRMTFPGGAFCAVVEPARRGRYLEVPGGPLLSDSSSVSLWKKAVSLMKETAKNENCAFIRIRPQVLDTPESRFILRSIGLKPAPMHLHAELTRILDLTKTNEQLLAEMRKSTRYEIRRAQKLGIEVEQSDDENLVDEFVKLQTETAKRERFVPFAKKYLLEQFRAFQKQNAVKWFFVSNPIVISSERRESRDLAMRSISVALGDLDSSATLGMTREIISIAFVIFNRGEAVYHYAASSDEARKIPAAYAIQWAIIQEAKKRGCSTYNLWGDVADDQLSAGWRRHRFSGPSLFKRGFGGQQVAYLHAHDLPLSWKYRVDWVVEFFRGKFRNLT